MRPRPATALLAAILLLGACDRYTDQTSPCFGRNGQPSVTQSSMSFMTTDAGQIEDAKDCVFERLPRPE